MDALLFLPYPQRQLFGIFLFTFSSAAAGSDWRVLLHLLQSYEDTAKEIAKYIVASGQGTGSGKQSWQDVIHQLTVGELRIAVAAASQSKAATGLAGAAVAVAGKDKLLQVKQPQHCQCSSAVLLIKKFI